MAFKGSFRDILSVNTASSEIMNALLQSFHEFGADVSDINNVFYRGNGEIDRGELAKMTQSVLGQPWRYVNGDFSLDTMRHLSDKEYFALRNSCRGHHFYDPDIAEWRMTDVNTFAEHLEYTYSLRWGFKNLDEAEDYYLEADGEEPADLRDLIAFLAEKVEIPDLGLYSIVAIGSISSESFPIASKQPGYALFTDSLDSLELEYKGRFRKLMWLSRLYK